MRCLRMACATGWARSGPRATGRASRPFATLIEASCTPDQVAAAKGQSLETVEHYGRPTGSVCRRGGNCGSKGNE
jgi:hypothetical protein